MQAEMLDQERSLSYAIYEYSALCGNGFLTEQNLEAREKWSLILEYGIGAGLFP